MKKLPSFLAIAVVLAMLLSLAACASPASSTAPAAATPAAAATSASATTAAAESATATPAPTPAPKVDFADAPVIKVMVDDTSASARSTSGYTEKDNPYVRFLFDNTGVNVQLVYQPDESYQEKVQLVLASGDAPDYISLTGDDNYAINTARFGALEPLNSYLDKYPNIMSVYNDAYWKNYSFDANKYFLNAPYIFPEANIGVLIRQDWLTKLNLQMPKTVDDLYNVCKAFVQSKPDGQQNTFGLITRKGLDNFWAISAAYGNPSQDVAYPYIYVDPAGKKLVLWNTTDAARAYYKEIEKWWKDGLIDKEGLTTTSDQFWDKINNGQVGVVCHHAEASGWLTTWMRQTQKKSDPTLVMMPALTSSEGYKNQYGTNGYEKTRDFPSYWGIPKGSKNIDNVLKVIDFECSAAFNNFAIYGLEGYEYTLSGGKITANTDYRQNKSFFGDYVFSFNKASFTDDQNQLVYLNASGGGDTNYDPVDDAMARTKQSFDLTTQTAVPYQGWIAVVPRLEIEDLHPDVNTVIQDLSIKLTTGELDASNDADWAKYLKAVDDSGINDIIVMKEQYLKQNAPQFFN